MRDTRSFSGEAWLSDRQAFIFRCHDPCRGDLWTFRVSRPALQALHPEVPFIPAAVFDSFRAAIYSAALSRMSYADPIQQHELSAEDVREGIERLLDLPSNCLPEARRSRRG
jgi:hypothetical protein